MAVYENGSILSASNKLFISQPAVSVSIKKLEEFLGGPLFIRMPKGVKPTAEGIAFYGACRDLSFGLKQAVEDYKQYLNLQKGTLNIGSSSTIIRALLLPFINKFTKKYPEIQIIIHDGISSQLASLLQKGEIDLAIMNEPLENGDLFNKKVISQTTDCFIVNPKSEKDFISKKELKDYPLIVQKMPSNNRLWFEKMCAKNKVNLTPKYETSSFGLISDFVGQNMGIGYSIREFIQKDLDSNKIKIIKTDFETEPRNVSLFTLKVQADSILMQKFVEELMKYFKKKN